MNKENQNHSQEDRRASETQRMPLDTSENQKDFCLKDKILDDFVKKIKNKKNLWANGNDIDMITIELKEFDRFKKELENK